MISLLQSIEAPRVDTNKLFKQIPVFYTLKSEYIFGATLYKI
jgi:hypothetical protein